jgi:outer membrane protein assembly factor BamB
LLDRKSGNAAWVYDLNLNRANTSDFVLNDVDSTPVVKNGVAYAIGNGGLMMAIRINDGVILWQKELASIADFWIAGDFIYLINNSNQLICLYSKTGSIKWISNFKNYKNDKKPATHIVYNGVIMAGGNLIMTNQDEKLLVVSPIDGKVIQTKKLGQRIYHNPIAVNGKIYLHTIGTFTTNLVVIK